MSKKETKAKTVEIEVKAPVKKEAVKSVKKETVKPVEKDEAKQAKWGTVEWAEQHPYFDNEKTTRKQRALIRENVSDRALALISLVELVFTVFERMRKLDFSNIPDQAVALDQYASVAHQLTGVVLEQVSALANTKVIYDLAGKFNSAKPVAKAKKPAKK